MSFNWPLPSSSLRDMPLTSDHHSVVTIKLEELIEDGFDWGGNDYPIYTPKPNGVLQQEHIMSGGVGILNLRERLNNKIINQYASREICVIPPGIWKRFITRKLNLIMPVYNRLYKLIDDGRFDILEMDTMYQKSRSVYSEYPQSQIQGSNDYARDASDNENKHEKTGPVLDLVMKYYQNYVDVDELVVKDLECCFSSLLTVNMNSY